MIAGPTKSYAAYYREAGAAKAQSDDSIPIQPYRLVNEVKPMLLTARKVGVDIEEPKRLINDAIAAGKRRDIDRAVALVSQSKVSLERSFAGQIAARVDSLLGDLEKAKAGGSEVAPVEGEAHPPRQQGMGEGLDFLFERPQAFPPGQGGQLAARADDVVRRLGRGGELDLGHALEVGLALGEEGDQPRPGALLVLAFEDGEHALHGDLGVALQGVDRGVDLAAQDGLDLLDGELVHRHPEARRQEALGHPLQHGSRVGDPVTPCRIEQGMQFQFPIPNSGPIPGTQY